jgi:hypothetical protein
MAQTSVPVPPIPEAKKEDSEDVAWALSTAEAMYARGDREEAVKWLRRAAEAASEGQADMRALQLAKAASDLATAIGRTPSTTPPPLPAAARSAHAPAHPPPPPSAPKSAAPSQRPPPVSVAASQLPHPPPSQPSRPPPPPKVTVRIGVASSSVRPVAPASVRPPPASVPNATLTPQIPPSAPRVVSTPPTPAVASAPVDQAGDDITRELHKLTAEGIPALPVPIPPAPVSEPVPLVRPRLRHDDDDEPPFEKTRIGVPAYQASAKMVTEATHAEAQAALPTTQAVRVIVWQGPDGVHVAPHGTRVSAPAIDAMLVAMDPSADLTIWLTRK